MNERPWGCLMWLGKRKNQWYGRFHSVGRSPDNIDVYGPNFVDLVWINRGRRGQITGQFVVKVFTAHDDGAPGLNPLRGT